MVLGARVGEMGAVVTVPTARDLLVCHVDASEEFVNNSAAMLAMSYTRHLAGPNSVSRNALWWRPGEPLPRSAPKRLSAQHQALPRSAHHSDPQMRRPAVPQRGENFGAVQARPQPGLHHPRHCEAPAPSTVPLLIPPEQRPALSPRGQLAVLQPGPQALPCRGGDMTPTREHLNDHQI